MFRNCRISSLRISWMTNVWVKRQSRPGYSWKIEKASRLVPSLAGWGGGGGGEILQMIQLIPVISVETKKRKRHYLRKYNFFSKNFSLGCAVPFDFSSKNAVFWGYEWQVLRSYHTDCYPCLIVSECQNVGVHVCICENYLQQRQKIVRS